MPWTQECRAELAQSQETCCDLDMRAMQEESEKNAATQQAAALREERAVLSEQLAELEAALKLAQERALAAEQHLVEAQVTLEGSEKRCGRFFLCRRELEQRGPLHSELTPIPAATVPSPTPHPVATVPCPAPHCQCTFPRVSRLGDALATANEEARRAEAAAAAATERSAELEREVAAVEEQLLAGAEELQRQSDAAAAAVQALQRELDGARAALHRAEQRLRHAGAGGSGVGPAGVESRTDAPAGTGLQQQCQALEQELRLSRRREEKLQALHYRLRADVKACGGDLAALRDVSDRRGLEFELDRTRTRAARERAVLKEQVREALARCAELQAKAPAGAGGDKPHRAPAAPLGDKENVL